MPTGTVKNYNANKAIGMIAPDSGGRDLVAFGSGEMRSVIPGLAEGKKVSYDVSNVKGRIVAVNIKLK